MRTKRNAGKVMDRVMAFRTGGGGFTFSVPWTPLAGWPSPGDLSQSNSFKCLKRKHVE